MIAASDEPNPQEEPEPETEEPETEEPEGPKPQPNVPFHIPPGDPG